VKRLKLYEDFDFNDDDFDFEEENEPDDIKELWSVLTDKIYELYSEVFVRFVPKGRISTFKNSDGIIIEDLKHRKDILLIKKIKGKLRDSTILFQLTFLYDRFIVDNEHVVEQVMDIVKQLKTSMDETGVYVYKHNPISENFDFNDEDFDFAEDNEYDYPFEIDDTIFTTLPHLDYWITKLKKWARTQIIANPHKVADIKHASELDIDNVGYMVQLESLNHVWFKAKDFKLFDIKNENFDFNDEDFDFDEEDENPDISIPDEEFVKFLKDNNCYDRFIENFNDHLKSSRKFHKSNNLYDYIKSRGEREDFIQYAFDWELDDYNFWENLEGNWMEILNPTEDEPAFY